MYKLKIIIWFVLKKRKSFPPHNTICQPLKKIILKKIHFYLNFSPRPILDLWTYLPLGISFYLLIFSSPYLFILLTFYSLYFFILLIFLSLSLTNEICQTLKIIPTFLQKYLMFNFYINFSEPRSILSSDPVLSPEQIQERLSTIITNLQLTGCPNYILNYIQRVCKFYELKNGNFKFFSITAKITQNWQYQKNVKNRIYKTSLIHRPLLILTIFRGL